MAARSGIEWTETTWNPVTGCSKVSAGCKRCYAERMAKRLQLMGQSKYRNGFRLTVHDDELDRPYEWREPSTVFVNSMSDLFHDDVPLEFIERVFETMARTRRHTYQILTKRSARLREVGRRLSWTPNIWMGVSVEDAAFVHRIDDLRGVPAEVRFISAEPLLGPLAGLDLSGIGWMVVGGESGPGARPMDLAWAAGLRDQCVAADVPFFFKQIGGVNKKKAGRLLDGRTWDEMPRERGREAAPGATPRSVR